MRRAAKVDANQTEIVAALSRVGASVQSLHTVGRGVPDLLVGFRGQTYLLEVKNRDGKNKIEETQKEWHRSWKGTPALIVESVEQALRAIGAI